MIPRNRETISRSLIHLSQKFDQGFPKRKRISQKVSNLRSLVSSISKYLIGKDQDQMKEKKKKVQNKDPGIILRVKN
jgi:hypothetical protein